MRFGAYTFMCDCILFILFYMCTADLWRAKTYAYSTACMVFATMVRLASLITPWQDIITMACLQSPFQTHLSLLIREALKFPIPHLGILLPKHQSRPIKSQKLSQWALSCRAQVRKHQRVKPRKLRQFPRNPFMIILTRLILSLSLLLGEFCTFTPPIPLFTSSISAELHMLFGDQCWQ